MSEQTNGTGKLTLNKDTTIRTSLGFVLWVIAGIGGIIAIGSIQAYQIDELKRQSQADRQELRSLREEVAELNQKLVELSWHFKAFDSKYDRDMNKYIRDNPREGR